MTAEKLKGLSPEEVFSYFEKICSIPHGSGNTKQISDYLVSVACEKGLKYIQDSVNNVIIFCDGSKGREKESPVIIQGHMDMVCEKDADCSLDMEKEGLKVETDGEFVFAEGTTLGGDDGIAVAFALALLDNSEISHPPLEILITVDEETGMDGALAVDMDCLKGKRLINIDSEDEGIFTVACAGGVKSEICIKTENRKPCSSLVKISVKGLCGGHSGIEIHKNRANSNVVLSRILKAAIGEYDLRLCGFQGGTKDNAIPRSSEAVVEFPDFEKLQEITMKMQEEVRRNYCEPDAVVTVEQYTGNISDGLSREDSRKIIEFLNDLPNGVIGWSKEIKGLVETSLNLGIAKLGQNGLSVTFSVRSSKNSKKRRVTDALKQITVNYNGEYKEKGDYPAWEYKEISQLRDTFVKCYKELYKKEPCIEAIHAGLECGILCEKVKGLDCISFGPQMYDIHTSREKLDVKSVERSWKLLLEVLKTL